ncbi:hypothetical protein G7046_g6103 [Stylonectria norvegica]|nr:hypothetical protein G7046_g6103 [Stylonectria norvegica]
MVEVTISIPPSRYWLSLILDPSVLFVLVAVCWLTFWCRYIMYPMKQSKLKDLPGPTDNTFFLGQSGKFLQVDWIPNLFCEWSREHPIAPFIRYLNFANTETLLPNTIDAYKDVLVKMNSRLVKPAFARSFAWETIGNGLPFDEGRLHRTRRAAISKPFTAARVRDFYPFVQAKASQLCDVLATKLDSDNRHVEVESHVFKAVLDVIGKETLGVDFNHLETSVSPLHEAFTQMMQPSLFGQLVNYINAIIPIRWLIPFGECREFIRQQEKVRDFIRCFVKVRRTMIPNEVERQFDEPDALQCLLDYSDPSWGENEIVEHILNLLVLGHDTTACSITWGIWELCRNYDLEHRMRREIQDLKIRSPFPTWDEINKLPFLHNFVREILRKYCAVALAPREATVDMIIEGTFIPKGTLIQLSPAIMNMHPMIWGEKAEAFTPDRWDDIEDGTSAASAYALETFHNGPRMCMGKQLAMMEMKVFLMELNSRF